MLADNRAHAGCPVPCRHAAAYSGIQTVMGDEVTISGAATSGPYVYLFLTGPNLPENGVALHDITKRADQGYFTKVSVDGDDRWSYTWHTGSINGKLDEGTYTIWVVSGPNDRSRLAQADYRTICRYARETLYHCRHAGPARQHGPAVGPGRGIGDGQRGLPRKDPARDQRSLPQYVYGHLLPVRVRGYVCAGHRAGRKKFRGHCNAPAEDGNACGEFHPVRCPGPA